jgi:hypothetical protein
MPKERITNYERDEFISNCIAKGYTMRVYKVRPALGKKARKIYEFNKRIQSV